MNTPLIDQLKLWPGALSKAVVRFNSFPFYDADSRLLPAILRPLDRQWGKQNPEAYRRMQSWWFKHAQLSQEAILDFQEQRFRLALLPASVIAQTLTYAAAGYHHHQLLKIITRQQRESAISALGRSAFEFATLSAKASLSRLPAAEQLQTSEGQEVGHAISQTALRIASASFGGGSSGFLRRLRLKAPDLDWSGNQAQLSPDDRRQLTNYLKGILIEHIDSSWKPYFT